MNECLRRSAQLEISPVRQKYLNICIRKQRKKIDTVILMKSLSELGHNLKCVNVLRKFICTCKGYWLKQETCQVKLRKYKWSTGGVKSRWEYVKPSYSKNISIQCENISSQVGWFLLIFTISRADQYPILMSGS